MAKRSWFESERGIAFLEAALSFVVLIPALLGAFATVAYMREASQVRKIVERYVSRPQVSIYSFSSQDGPLTLSTNHSGIEEAVRNTVEAAESEIEARGEDPNLSGEYFLEAAYAELRIDQETGEPLGLVREPSTFSRSAGGLFVPAEVNSATDLGDAFSRLAGTTISDEPGSRSVYATPSVFFGDGTQRKQYFPTVILFGLRIILSLDGTFSGEAYEQVGGDPFVYHARVVALRGELGHEE
ncbi:MAG: hypothetical protein KDD64_01515 [Bdellovibrionales bacterium]|nr:hypothetical protein [Bdellovibrionales bacterium]